MNRERLAAVLAMLIEDGHITPQGARILTITDAGVWADDAQVARRAPGREALQRRPRPHHPRHPHPQPGGSRMTLHLEPGPACTDCGQEWTGNEGSVARHFKTCTWTPPDHCTCCGRPYEKDTE